MATDVIIRAARASDADAICAIWNPIIYDTAYTFTTDPKTPEGLRADIAARGRAFLVAERDGQVIGFATYFPFRGGPGYAQTKEHTIHLSSRAFGGGVGRTLMSALCDVARDEGVHSLWAGVSGENPGGVAFHKAIGFQEIATLPQVGHKFGRWMDLVLLMKRL